MDIGDLLNVLLAVIVIVISIALALNLPYIAYGASGQENPFAIYQIAISLNYFSSFPGEFHINVSYPGINQCEFRIARFVSDKGNSYVSEGYCDEKDHAKELAFDIISAILTSIPIDISGLSKGASMGKLVVKTVIEAGKIFLWNEFISFIMTTAVNLLSGNPIDMFSSFIRNVAKQRLRYFAQVAAEKSMEFADILIGLLVNSVVRYVLGFTGIYGFAINFVINFGIAIADNIYNWIRGATDVAYNCLKQGGPRFQYVYMEYNKVYYSQNLHMPLEFQNILIGGKSLSGVADDWLYKVSMTEEVGNEIYVLSSVEIYTENDKIKVNPVYINTTKQ